jgi:hypothetical protein
VRGGAQVLRVVAALAFALMADLQQELALPRELQDVRVLVAARAQPDVVLVVDVDAVLELRPFVAGAGPPQDETSVPSSLNSSTGGAAFQNERVSFGCRVDGRCVIQMCRANPRRRRPPHQPASGWARLRPGRIDLIGRDGESGRLTEESWRASLSGEPRRAGCPELRRRKNLALR